MPELLERRTRNSKTFHLGGRKYAWDGVIGAIHYKDNPKDEAEQWKDIDTTIVDGKVSKAPYDLDIYLDGMPGFHYKSKESGEFNVRLKCARQIVRLSPERVFELEPVIPKPRIEGNKVIWENIYPDTDVILEAWNTGVCLKRILKSAKAPLEYDVDIQEVKGIATLRPLRPATDANDQQLVMEEKAITGGRTEKLKLEVLPEEGVEPQPITFPIKDSTVVDEDIGASEDDTRCIGTNNYYTSSQFNIGNSSGTLYHAGGRWAVNIAQGSTIDVAYISIYVYDEDDPLGDLYCEDIDTAPNFTNGNTVVPNRTRTSASSEWDATNIGKADWKNSPSIVGAVQEVISREGWEANNYLAVLGIGKGATTRIIRAYSYDEGPGTYPPKLYIEYTAAAAGWTHKYLGVANASIGKINGVAKASIKKVNGVE